MNARTPSGIYDHYRGGRYRVLFTTISTTNATNGRIQVVYVSLSLGEIFVRDEEEFHAMIPGPRGGARPRFKKVD